MKLSSLDIRHMEFERTAMGYRTRQVKEFLERVASESESTLHELQVLRATVGEQRSEIEGLRATEAELKRTVVAAERIANDVKDQAIREADLLVRQAKQERIEMLRDTAAQLDAARTELARLDHAQALVREQLRGQLTAFLAALDAKPAGRRQSVADVSEDVIAALKATVAEARADVAEGRPGRGGGRQSGASAADGSRAAGDEPTSEDPSPAASEAPGASTEPSPS